MDAQSTAWINAIARVISIRDLKAMLSGYKEALSRCSNPAYRSWYEGHINDIEQVLYDRTGSRN